jgi:putative addiction module component (TIGR02574 family)
VVLATEHDGSRRPKPKLRTTGDAVEEALANALRSAAGAGRWDVVAQLASELETRRRARASNVVPLRGASARKGYRRPSRSYGTLSSVTRPARKLLEEALALSERERLQLASEIIASIDGPQDADWDAAWLAELDRRAEAAKARGETAADWSDVRARILQRLGRA